MTAQFRDPRLPRRFWNRLVIKQDDPYCWEWQPLSSERKWSYGSFAIDGRSIPAHRSAYEALVGPIGPGLYVCHWCDNPPCCKPSHLFIGTPRDNSRDMVAKGRHVGGRNGPVTRPPEQWRYYVPTHPGNGKSNGA